MRDPCSPSMLSDGGGGGGGTLSSISSSIVLSVGGGGAGRTLSSISSSIVLSRAGSSPRARAVAVDVITENRRNSWSPRNECSEVASAVRARAPAGRRPTHPTQGMDTPLHFDPHAAARPASGIPPAQTKVMVAHVGFKAAALFTYLTSGFGSSYVMTFVMVTILSALDFWTVKNITGRLLVGLRWFNHIDEAGKSHWQFMSFEDQRVIHPTDSSVFWIGIFVAPAVWILIAIATVLTLRLMWLVLVLVCVGLTLMNTVGYVKCKRDAGRKISAIGGTVLSRGLEAWTSARSRMGDGAQRVPSAA